MITNFNQLKNWYGFLQTIETALQKFSAHQALAGKHCQMRENTLTKPIESLGRLEQLSHWFYHTRGIYDNLPPEKLITKVLVFAGNHGVAANQVSAFPAIVTEAMVKNFETNGAAINQLAKWAKTKLEIIPMNNLLANQNFANKQKPTPALNQQEFCTAINIGFQAIDKTYHAIVLGEMGIANSTAAAAICHCLYGGNIKHWVGRGTGIDDHILTNKQQAVKIGVKQYQKLYGNKKGLITLQFFGGFEMAAIAGAIIAGLYHHIPIILDSYTTIACLACLAPHFQNPNIMLAGIMTPHRPADNRQTKTLYQGHKLLLNHLNKTPPVNLLVDLNMRLGEGTDGVIALQLLKAALACHHGMATFDSAKIANKIL
ncbi:MAG: nicotinate-nucleotide--dimethylbenzimidazole phosphoribosyltransferase [Alphaproteobacteria bacterium]